MLRVAIIGAGWAGMAAAVSAAQAGHAVTVLEASRSLGGRARGLDASLPDGRPLRLDNGQHILIGAYSQCLQLMRDIGLQPEALLLRQPLTLRYPDGSGLALPDAAPPWDAAWGIARARGWHWRERLALLQQAARWRANGFGCDPALSVTQLCAGLPQRLFDELIEPLCVSALNTPAAQACGATFARARRQPVCRARRLASAAAAHRPGRAAARARRALAASARPARAAGPARAIPGPWDARLAGRWPGV